MDEFGLIRDIVENLADRAEGPWIDLGPGDDAALICQTPDHQLVASIDTLLADTHFPASMSPELVGYRALMVSLSDLAAMAATPRYVLVALTLPTADSAWVAKLAQGMALAARECDTYLCGGNITKGPLSITVSVHGEVPQGRAVTRSGAQVGDTIFVSGALGGAAACVRARDFAFIEPLSETQIRYVRPRARVDLVTQLRGVVHAAIDISDGLLKDLQHMVDASGVQANIVAKDIPLCPGATLEDALYGGDDYEILCTAEADLSGFSPIGNIQVGQGVLLDGQALVPSGYNHFADA